MRRLAVLWCAIAPAWGCSTAPSSEEDAAWAEYLREEKRPLEQPTDPAQAPNRNPQSTWLDWMVGYYDPWIAEALGRFPDKPSWLAERWLLRAMKDRGYAKPGPVFAAQAPVGERFQSPVTPEAVAFLARTLDHEDRNVRSLAAFVLGQVGGPGREAAPRLAQALRDIDPVVRASAAHALGRLQAGDAAAVAALTEALKDEPWVRFNAARALVEVGADPRVTMPAFIDLLERGSDVVRAGAAYTLHKIARHAKDAVPALTRCLDSRDRLVRGNAVYVLRDLGADARPALPALRARLADPEKDIRALAAEAIRAIEKP